MSCPVRAWVLLSCLIWGLLAGGCSGTRRVTGVADTFLKDVDITKKMDNIPLEHAWVWADLNKKEFHAIYIAPIEINTIEPGSWVRSASGVIPTERDFIKETASIARYFRLKLQEEIRASQNLHLPLVEQPGPGVVEVRIALTEIEFSHPVGRAAALAVPIPGTGAAMSTVTDPHVAFAARVVDSGTGELIATAADRKFAPLRILDFNKLTATKSTREITAAWATILAECFKKGPKGDVENQGVVALLPW